MAKQSFTTGQVLTAAQVNSLQANDFNQTVSPKTASYVLVASDKGTRIEFNTSGSVTCTVNTGLFDAGDTVYIQNRGAGVVTITAGTATVNTSASLAVNQWEGGVLYFISASASVWYEYASTANGDITGVTAGTGISGGGTSGDVTITNTMATTIDAKGDLIVGTADNSFSRLAVSENGSTLVADSSATTGLRWSSQFLAGKNKLINGDFNIWQRGTSFTATGYTADRWLIDADTTSFSQSRQSFTVGTAPVAGYEGTFFMRTTRGTGGTYCNSQQRIEDVRTFANQTVTLSFWAKASASCTIEPYYIQVFGTGGSSAVSGSFGTTTTLTTSWVRYSYTVTIPSISGKTIGTGSYLNILVARITSSTNVDVDTWGVQLEAGSVATPFSTATGTLAGELAACQRYYYRIGRGSDSYESFNLGVTQSTTSLVVPYLFPTTMRTAPSSVTFSNLAASDGSTLFAASAAGLFGANATSTRVNFTIATATNGRAYWLSGNNNTSAFLAFDAEL